MDILWGSSRETIRLHIEIKMVMSLNILKQKIKVIFPWEGLIQDMPFAHQLLTGKQLREKKKIAYAMGFSFPREQRGA